MATDLRLILTVQAVRALGYGFGSVLLGTTLAASGLSAGEVGLVFAAIIAGMAAGSLVVGRYADRVGRRRTYLGLLAVMGLAGAAFALTDAVWLLVLAALTGTLSTDSNESGPMTTLEQSMLAGTAPGGRTRAFGRYNAVAYLAGAAGALLAALPGAIRHTWAWAPAEQRWLLAFPILAAGAMLVAARLSDTVELSATGAPAAVGAPAASDATAAAVGAISPAVRRLAALFALDAFAGGFIVQAFIVFWFGRAFGASTQTMGVVFFTVGLLQAGSSILAGRLARRIGLLPTMVFTHIPSNVLLCLIPVAGSLPVAIGLLLARATLSQMDVPARQAYVVSVVDPASRTAAAAYTNSARYLGRPAGAALAGSVMGGVGLAAPFLLAGGLKIVYDLALWVSFRSMAIRPD